VYQPLSVTVPAGSTATFSVIAAGSPTLRYQWQENGMPITGATSASYTTPVLSAADNGAAFTVQVMNGAGIATSNAATITIGSFRCSRSWHAT
jgi:beta-galactosidase